MDMLLTEPDFAKIKKLINAVDLSSTINRLVKVHHWKNSLALKAVQQYRNYLFLKKKYGKTYSLPPSYDIDEVWHAHILHTEDYYTFCKEVFGDFLHHHPHHGKNNSITDQEIAEGFKKTQELYYTEFGEYIYAVKPIPFKIRLKRLFMNSSGTA